MCDVSGQGGEGEAKGQRSAARERQAVLQRGGERLLQRPALGHQGIRLLHDCHRPDDAQVARGRQLMYALLPSRCI